MKNRKTEQPQSCIRFNNVMLFLSDYGIKYKKIINAIKEYTSEYVKGIRNIDDDFETLNKITDTNLKDYRRNTVPKSPLLKVLHEKYYINPDYVSSKADWMVDFHAENFDKLKETNTIKPHSVISARTTDNDKKYLTVQMDSNLHEYLITISPEHFTKAKTTLNENEREDVNKIYKRNYEKKEYLLIPYDRIAKRELLENPVNFENELSLLIKSYEILENRVDKLFNKSIEETEEIISEIHNELNKIKKLSDKYKKFKNKN